MASLIDPVLILLRRFRHRIWRGIAPCLSLLILFIQPSMATTLYWLTPGTPQPNDTHRTVVQTAADVLSLEPGKSIERLIAGGETHFLPDQAYRRAVQSCGRQPTRHRPRRRVLRA